MKWCFVFVPVDLASTSIAFFYHIFRGGVPYIFPHVATDLPAAKNHGFSPRGFTLVAGFHHFDLGLREVPPEQFEAWHLGWPAALAGCSSAAAVFRWWNAHDMFMGYI